MVGEPPGRNTAVDALRGFSILLVVLGHAIANAENLQVATAYNLQHYASRFLYTFHMPLFFVISGYVLFGKRIAVRDRALRLLLPFVAWIPVYYLVNRYIHHWPASFLTSLKDTLLHPAIGLWFLPTLFLCSVLLVPARRLESWKGWSVGAYLAAAFVIVNILPFDDLGVMQVKYFFPYFAAGYLAAKHMPRLERIGKNGKDALLLACSTAFLVLFTFLYYYGRINPYEFPVSLPDLFSEPLGYVIRYSMAALGIASSVTVVRALKDDRARTVLAWFGLVTMDIYVSHFLMLQLTFGSGWLKVLVSCVTGTALPLALSFLVLRQWSVTALLFLGLRQKGKRQSRSGI